MENFNELALNWDAEPRRLERAKVVAGEIISSIPGMSELEAFEYGCGTGLLSMSLQQNLNKIWLGDSSEGMLKVLQDKIEKHGITNMKTLRIDLTTDELPKHKFDLIYTLMTLHHIMDTDSIIKAFHKLLRPAGYLCIADLDKEDGSFHEDDFTGHNGFDRIELTQLLIEAGFEIISDKICYNNIKKSSSGENRGYPMFLIICRKMH